MCRYAAEPDPEAAAAAPGALGGAWLWLAVDDDEDGSACPLGFLALAVVDRLRAALAKRSGWILEVDMLGLESDQQLFFYPTARSNQAEPG